MSKKTHNFSQSEYYQKRKGELSEIRKNKYLNDPQFQEAAKQRAREAYNRKKSISESERISPETFRIGSTIYHTVGYIAKRCNITASLINYYHEQDYLPLPKEIGGYSRRRYHNELAEAMIPAILSYVTREIQKPEDMYNKIKKSLGKQKFEELCGGQYTKDSKDNKKEDCK